MGSQRKHSSSFKKTQNTQQRVLIKPILIGAKKVILLEKQHGPAENSEIQFSNARPWENVTGNGGSCG